MPKPFTKSTEPEHLEQTMQLVQISLCNLKLTYYFFFILISAETI